MAPYTTQHELLYDFDHGIAPGGTIQPDAVSPGDQASLSFNGPHLKIEDASKLLTPIVMPPAWRNVCRFYQSPADTANTDPGTSFARFINSVGSYDALESDYDPSNLPELFYAHHYNNQRYFYVTGCGIYDHQLDPSDPLTGGWNYNAAGPYGQPVAAPKVIEFTHADQYIDGAYPLSFYSSLSSPLPGTSPPQGGGYHGHNAFGIGILFNRPDFLQFDPTRLNAQRPWNVAGATQTARWQDPRFDVPLGDYTPYWTTDFGWGDVTLHDNTGEWALRPVVPNEFMWFITEKLQLDFSGDPGDTTPGVMTMRAISNTELIALGGSLAAALAVQPLVIWNGSTNQWAETNDTSVFDATNADAVRPANPPDPAHPGQTLPRSNPHYQRQRPTFPLAGLTYLVPNVPAGIPTYNPGVRRRSSLQAAWIDLVGSGTPAPLNTSLPTITGSAVSGSVLTASGGTWIGTPAPTLSYQWFRDGVSIGGAGFSTYTLTLADVSHLITVGVIGTSSSGTSNRVFSAAVGPVQNASQISVKHEASQSWVTFGTTDSQSFTVPAVANRYMEIGWCGKTSADHISGLTVNGAAATLISAVGVGSVHAELWGFIAPPSGAVTIAWTKTGSAQNIVWGASVFSGVHQTTPVGSPVTGANPGATSAAQQILTVPSAATDLISALAAFNGGATAAGPIAGPAATGRWTRNQSTTQGAFATLAGAAGNVNVPWTPSGSPNFDSALIAVNLLPAAVLPSPPVNQTLPNIGGMAIAGQLLTSTVGVFDEHGSPTIYTYQWVRCDSSGGSPSNISGATDNFYTLQTADIGHTIRVTVTATNAGGPTPATSAQTAVVVAAPTIPTNSVPPTYTGTAMEGDTLTLASNGTWTQSPTFSYLWLRSDAAGLNGIPITGATGSSYVLQAADVGHTIVLVVTGQNPAGQLSVQSAASATVTSSAGVARPSVTNFGLVATNGQTNLQVPMTIDADANLLVAIIRDSFTPAVVSPVTAGGQTMDTAGAKIDLSNGNTSGVEVWTMTRPPTGSVPLHVIFASPRTATIEWFAVKDCNVADPIWPIQPLVFSGGAPLLAPASGEDDLVIGILTFKHSAATVAPSDDVGETPIQPGIQVVNNGNYMRGETIVKDAAASADSTTVDWTIGPPAPAFGGTAVAFTIKAAGSTAPARPVPVGPPTIAGTGAVGDTLTVTDTGDWNNVDGSTDYSAVWVRDTLGDGVYVNVIPGATALSYTLQAPDAGSNVLAVVTAKTSAGTAEQESNIIGPIAVAFSTFIIDDFKRANENPLSQGGNWSSPMEGGAGVDPLKLVAYGLVTGSTTHDNQSYRVGLSQADSDTMLQITQLGAGGVGLWGRVQNVGNVSTMRAYSGVYLPGIGYQLYRVTFGGAFTQLGSTITSHVHAVGEYLRLKIAGTTVELSYGIDNGDGTFNWTVLLTETDIVVTGAGTLGVEINGSAIVVANYSDAVDSAAPTNSVLPSISGSAIYGSTLTANAGTWLNGPTSFDYQWRADGTAVGTNSSTYTVGFSDAGKTITVDVTATNGIGSQLETSAGVAAVGIKPAVFVTPVISGATYVGGIATVTLGGWSGFPDSYAQQWIRVDADGVSHPTSISGATFQSYRPTSADIGHRLVVRATATNTTGVSDAVFTLPTGIITEVNQQLFETLKDPFSGPLATATNDNHNGWDQIQPAASTIDTNGGVLNLTMDTTSGTLTYAERVDTHDLTSSHVQLQVLSAGAIFTKPAITVGVELGLFGHTATDRLGVYFANGVMRAGQTVAGTFSWLGTGVTAAPIWLRISELSGTVTISYALTYDELISTPTVLWSGTPPWDITALNLRLSAQSGGAGSGVATFDSLNTLPPAVNVGAPVVIPASPRVGTPASVDVGLWKYMGGPDAVFSVQWQEAGQPDAPDNLWTDIVGATDLVYTPTSDTAGDWLRAKVTARNEGDP